MAKVTYDQGSCPSVTLVLTPEEAQAVFDRLYVYETEDGFLARSVVARQLLDSGAVREVSRA